MGRSKRLRDRYDGAVEAVPDVLDRDLVEGHYRPCKDCFDLKKE